MKYLPFIENPSDLKRLSEEELTILADEIREELIATVSKTGGHLATNLGSVEFTIALHYVFDCPKDKFVWDVGHQVYPHKLLTGRRESFGTIRQNDGLSGFTKQTESEFDCYGAGHASTSISAALGLAAARDHAGLDHKVVAIIGDGSMTGGLAFEGLNNAGSSKRDLLVILNDNHWSISKNVGALSKYLTSIMVDEKFNRLRDEIWELTGRFKRRDKIRSTISHLEKSLKGFLAPGMVFQSLGFRYFGPIDGHDLPLVVRTMQSLKHLNGPIMLHLATVKGKGFQPAEGDPTKFHGVGKFDKVTGKPTGKTAVLPSYTNVFGDTLVELAEKDDKIVAITAAMTTGTGLVKFSEKFPDRLYDVGIAEGHAGCFAAGLATGGMKPYLTVYSTFMQRAMDQLIHDIALQKLPVVICMDRAGLVGADGPTHHGVFDLSLFNSVPNLTVAAPRDGNELRAMMHYTSANKLEGPVAIRYPRANVPSAIEEKVEAIRWGRWTELTESKDIVILGVGTMVTEALAAAILLKAEGLEAAVVNARFVKPLDVDLLDELRARCRVIVTVEENSLLGGFGSTVASHLISAGYHGRFQALGIPDKFITHGDRAMLLRSIELDARGIADTVKRLDGEAKADATEANRSVTLRQAEKADGTLFHPTANDERRHS